MKIRVKYLSSLAASIMFFLSISLGLLAAGKSALAAEDQMQQSGFELNMTPGEREAFQKATPEEREAYRTLKSILGASQMGPAKISLLDQAELDLPENYIFIPSGKVPDFQRLNGMLVDPDLKGIIISKEVLLRSCEVKKGY